MCKYCDGDSDESCIYFDSLTGEYYLDIETIEWDSHDNGFVYQREYISYCPYCGRKLDSKKEGVDMEKERRIQLFENEEVLLEKRGNRYFLSLYDSDGKFQREVTIAVKDDYKVVLSNDK